MVATFNGNPSATIISCYSPTYVSEETNLIAFYNELYYLVRSIPKHNVLVIGGDMNAKIGKYVNHKFSLHNSSNRNREPLTDFTQENRLTCLNTKFQKRDRKLWTYTSIINTEAQIDYVFINKKWKNSALYWERDLSSMLAVCSLSVADFQRGLEKIVLLKETESMRSARWLVREAESLGRDIDSREKIDLWLLHHPLLRRKAGRQNRSVTATSPPCFGEK